MTEDTRATWLASLKAGDQVATWARVTGYRIHTVARRTPSGQIIMEDGGRYDKYGREISGDRWDRRSIQPATEKILADIKHRRLVSAALHEIGLLQDANRLSSLSDEQLDELLAALKKCQEK